MPIKVGQDTRLGQQLKTNLRVGFRHTILCLLAWVISGVMLSPILLLGEKDPEYKWPAQLWFATIWIGISYFIFRRMIKVYCQSISCPKCGHAFNVGAFGNVSFSRKCRSCGLEIPRWGEALNWRRSHFRMDEKRTSRFICYVFAQVPD